VAMAMTVSLFSLAGLPFFAGFTTKFYLFTAAADGGLLWLVGLAITNSLISLYYYMMVMKQMYMEPAIDNTPLKISLVSGGALCVLISGVIVVGVYPGPLVGAIESATRALLP
jgi:NADH-quinone oxidoreductase subunit N